MRLTPQQIRSISTGVLDMKEQGSSLRLLRMTDAQRAVYTEDEVGWRRAQTTAGITLDLHTDSQTLTLACSDIYLSPSYHCAFDVLVDGEFYTSFSMATTKTTDEPSLASGFRHTFRLPEGNKRITLYFPLYTMQIDAVELDDGATLSPCHYSRKWVVFGDSISEGREPDHPCSSYVCRLARMLDAEVYNQAISGEIFRSRKIVPGTYPQCDFVSVAYGTNDFRKQEYDLLIPEVSSFFRQVTDAFPNVPIFYLLPLWRKDKDRVTRGRTLEEVRVLLRQEAEKYPQIHIIDCWDFIPHDEQYFFDQRLHPNDAGFAFYAEALYPEFKKHLPQK